MVATMDQPAVIFTLFALLVANVRSQSSEDLALLGSFPSCTTQCFMDVFPTSVCNITGSDCLCAHPTLESESVACFTAACSLKDAFRATNISAALCDRPIRDESDRGKISAILFTLLAFVFIMMRVIVRDPLKGGLFAWDDGLIIITFIVTVPLLPLHILLAENGIGRDIWTLPFDKGTQFLKLFYVFEIWYILSTMMVKMSMLFFYLRVFPKSRTTVVVKVTNFVVGFYGCTFLALVIFQCRPISYTFTGWTGETQGRCVDPSLRWAQASVNILLDVWVLLLPLPKLFKLQLNYSRKKKAGVFLMFSVGVAVTITSIMRMWALTKMYQPRVNFTWDWTACALWSGVEANTGIVCACLPAARLFFIKTLPNWLGGSILSTSRGIYACGSRTGASTRAVIARWPPAGDKRNRQENCTRLTDIQSTKSGSDAELATTNAVSVSELEDGYSYGGIHFQGQLDNRY